MPVGTLQTNEAAVVFIVGGRHSISSFLDAFWLRSFMPAAIIGLSAKRCSAREDLRAGFIRKFHPVSAKSMPEPRGPLTEV